MGTPSVKIDTTQKMVVRAILLVAALYGIFYLGQQNGTPEPITLIKTDTLTMMVPAQPIIIQNAKAQIEYRDIIKWKTKTETDTIVKYREGITVVDSLFATKPFTAVFDSVLLNDTVHAEYMFPEDIFSISIRQAPDTMRTKIMTIYRDKIIDEPWWNIPAYIISGVAAGYLLGNTK